MIWQTVKEWEKINQKDYPEWACVWHYDAYGECWESIYWCEIKDYYEQERKQKKGNALWDYPSEPMVCDPTLSAPKWGDGMSLKRKEELDG